MKLRTSLAAAGAAASWTRDGPLSKTVPPGQIKLGRQTNPLPSASFLADYLGRHQRCISLEHIRRDRILQEPLATGADPLHLALVFNIDHTNAMAYANAARNLLTGPAEQELSPHRPA